MSVRFLLLAMAFWSCTSTIRHDRAHRGPGPSPGADVLAAAGSEADFWALVAAQDESLDSDDGGIRTGRTPGKSGCLGEQEIAMLIRLTLVLERKLDESSWPKTAEIRGLIAKLSNPSWRVRMWSAFFLAQRPGDAETSIPALCRALHDSQPAVRRTALTALHRVGDERNLARAGKSRELLLAALAREVADQGARSDTAAFEILGRMGIDGIPLLLRGLKARHPAIRKCAARELAKKQSLTGPDLDQVVRTLAVALEDPVAEVRRNCLQALLSVEGEAPGIVGVLADRVVGPGGEVRKDVLVGLLLNCHRPGNTVAVPVLAGLLRSDDPEVRRTAAAALIQIGPKAVPAVAEALKDPEKEIRRQAVQILSALGGDARAAVSELIDAVGDPDDGVGEKATYALGNVALMGTIPAARLIPLLKHPGAAVRRRAMRLLGAPQIRRSSVIPAISEALADEDSQVRRLAVWSLGEMGAEAEETIPLVKQALKDSDATVRSYARRALTKIENAVGLESGAHPHDPPR